jgi:hypothetical protein
LKASAVIMAFTADGSRYTLYLGKSCVDLTSAVQEADQKRSLLAEISSAGFTYEEVRTD